MGTGIKDIWKGTILFMVVLIIIGLIVRTEASTYGCIIVACLAYGCIKSFFYTSD